MKEIKISTNLLEAVARFTTSPAAGRPHLEQVVFRSGEVTACDGHRLVRVPHDTAGMTIAIDRRDIATAIAAQDAWYAKSDCKRSTRSLRIRQVEKWLEIGLVDSAPGILPSYMCASGAPDLYPTEETTENVCRAPKPTTAHPSGMTFNADLLASIHSVVKVLDPSMTHGVDIAAWGGPLDGMLFKGPAGSRFMVMPMRGRWT